MVSIELLRGAKDIVNATGTLGISISYWCEDLKNGHVKPFDDDNWYELNWDRVPEIVFNPDGIRHVSVDVLNRLRSCFINHDDILDPDGYTDDILCQLAAFGEVVYG